ncbi:hypothetical protein AVEN_172703-1 [Araneus ventricosus]|uniref:TIL domain-containing protein n=1 Tax=Araneus ventricosus TaxID=182803 RepID=A0A4Y2RN87_ARAVE|nr:hypothetical protein AVEN_172703-1 [Araneus ventricosus]
MTLMLHDFAFHSAMCFSTVYMPLEPQPKCATDEQFYECTPNCKNTCENIYNPEAKCQCGPPGCFCKEGLVKREDGKCVPPEQCEVTPQPECNANEQFYECTPSCRNTCENFANPAARCYCGPPGCFCKEGLVKRADGKCVPPNQCHVKPQPECGADEQFYECKPSCKNTCSHFFNPGVKCRCAPPGCFCKKGLVKRSDGKCVPPSECPGECFADHLSNSDCLGRILMKQFFL